MSCPDWIRLNARRDLDPEAWERGLEHFDACGHCIDEALAAEPTLIFRRLPAPAVSRDDVAAMKQAVAVLRRSSVRRSSRETAAGGGAARVLPALRAAALAVLVLGAAALQGGGRAGGRAGGGAAETLAEIDLRPASQLDELQLIEAVDPSYGSVIQFVDDEISLVVVLPANDV